MLWTIIAILLVLWLLGLIGNIGGGLIWLLLVIAAIVLRVPAAQRSTRRLSDQRPAPAADPGERPAR